MSPSDRTSVTVRIAGEEHVIRSNADPEYTRRCATFVDQRITQIRGSTALLENHKVAILAALSITDQYLQAREELEALRREVATRAEALTQRIDAELGDGSEG